MSRRFDFDASDGVSGTDFLTAAKHEIGHVLGFFSGADDVDYFTLPEGPEAPRDLSEYGVINVPHLFRISEVDNCSQGFSASPVILDIHLS